MQPKCGALKKILVQEEKREKHYDQSDAHTARGPHKNTTRNQQN